MKKSHTIKHSILFWCVLALGACQVAWGATLTNRYSFNGASGTTATDSVGGKNGTLINTSLDGSGQVTLVNGVNTSSDPSAQYVDLPENIVSNYSAITIETWITPTLDDVTGGAFWARIWDFGNSDGVNGVAPFFWFRVGNDSQPIRGDIVTTNQGNVLVGSTLVNQQQSHIVWTSDGSSAKVYVNGVLVGSNDNFTNTPAMMGVTTNDWLGRSQFSADPLLNGSYNEFRIYDGALNPLEVAADYEAGPDTVNPGYGTVTNIALQVTPTMPVETVQTAKVFAQASGLTNKDVDIVDSSLAVTFSSDDTNILTVSSKGVISAINPGSATVQANYSSFSSSQTITVHSTATRLLNRYSFNDGTANDSVGGQNGNTIGSASVSGGKLVLPGGAGNYLNLPPYLISTTNMQTGAFTIETWTTVSTNIAAFAPLCMFGNSDGTLGNHYMLLTPFYNNPASDRFAVGTDFSSEDFAAGPSLSGGIMNAQIVGVYQPGANSIQLFVNGSQVGAGTLNNGTTLATIDNVYSFIGQSLFSADSTFSGDIDEFRIYDGALNRFQIDAAYVNGPDSTNIDIGTLQNFDLSVGTPTTIQVGEYRQMSASMHFTIATNVNVLYDPNLTLTSSDTSVLTVTSPAGVIHSVGTGTASVTGVYAYTSGNTTTYYTNTSVALTVVAPTSTPSTLIHRYSFNDGTADDSVGTANGTLMNSATVDTNGQLALNNPGFSAGGTNYPNGFLDLPASIVPTSGGGTFEMWFTFTGSGFYTEGFTFCNGSDTSPPSGAGGEYVMQTISCPQPANPFGGPGTGGNRIGQSLNGYTVGPEILANGTTPGMGVNGGGYLDGGYNCMVAVTIAPDGTLSYYLWSISQGGIGGLQLRLAGYPLSDFSFTHAYLGRSAFATDNGTSGTIDEFRVYSGTRSQAEIEQDYAAGPNALPSNAPTLSIVPGAGTVVISWPTNNASGFTLQSSPSLGSGASWSTVGGVTPSGDNYQATVPITNSAQFFRLMQ